jgi:hypothetical protein
MAKKMSHLALLFGGVLLFILFFVMVTGKKEGFQRPPGPACNPAKVSVKGENSNSECTDICASKAKSAADETQACNGGYYRPTTVSCECFMKK